MSEGTEGTTIVQELMVAIRSAGNLTTKESVRITAAVLECPSIPFELANIWNNDLPDTVTEWAVS